jgi:hypothetical protein
MRKLALVVSILAACSDSSTTVVMQISATPPVYGTTPFPTDALRDGDHLGVIDGLAPLMARRSDVVASHVAALDGFGLRPLVELFVTGPIDPESLAGAAFVVDVDPDSPERGREIAMEWRFDAERSVIQGRPMSGELLREGTRYAAYVTTDVRAADGERLARAESLDDLSSAATRWKTTATALRELDRTKSVAGISVFTTQHATAPLVEARNILATLPPSSLSFPEPAFVFSGTTQLDRVLGVSTRATDGPRVGLERWGNDNPTGIAHDHVGVVASGQMTIPRFRRDDTKTDDPEDETFTTPPTVIAMDTIPVTFILPSSPMPSNGYPVIIYGHGLSASRDQLFSFAEPLTSQGYAIVGIDMAGHGSRYSPDDVVANMSLQLKMFSGEAQMKDGFGDTTGAAIQFDFFEGFLNVSAARDGIRQSALDLSRLTQMLRRPDLDLSALAGPGSATPKLDTTRIAYLGESFGTVVGTLFASIEPEIQLFVLDVPGGGIIDTILPDSAEIGSLAVPLIENIYGTQFRLDHWNPLIGLMQAVMDGADPLSYAPHVLRDRFTIGGTPLAARSVVALEVLGDQVLPNSGTEALARGLGVEVLTPDLVTIEGLSNVSSPAAGNLDGTTAVLVQYSPATHGANWSGEKGKLMYVPGFPHEGENRFPKLATPVVINNPIYKTHEQVAEILATYFAGQAPLVRSTEAPIADFDDDGRPDADDTDPFDPSR